jgi:DNA polymerase-3 subunit alpha
MKFSVNEIKNLAEEESLSGETIQQAKVLEGSLRNTGIHACGVIITPDDITNLFLLLQLKIPICM